MERLTYEGRFCDLAMCQEPVCPYPDTGCSQKQVWERLKEYEDAEQAGRVINLDEKISLAMCAGARAIEKNRDMYCNSIYVFDPLGEAKEMRFSEAANILREAGEPALKGEKNEVPEM